MDKETPITKYLATLERRQAQREREMLYGSPIPGTSPESMDTVNIRQQLRFEDETFLQPHDQTVMHYSPPSQSPLLPSTTPNIVTPNFALPPQRTDSSGGGIFTTGFKRKRYSFEDHEVKEDHIKKITELQKLLRQTNGELVESRAITAKLERQKMELRTESYDKALQYEKSMAEMKIKCRNAVDKREELEKDNEIKSKKLDELKEELRRQSTLHTEKILAMESKVSQLQCENVELKQQYEEDKLNLSGSMKKMSTDLQESEKGTEKWTVECEILKDQLSLKETQLAKYVEELKEAQSIILKYNELNQKLNAMDSSEAQTIALQDDVKKYENLYVQQQNKNNRTSQLLTKLTEENNYLRSSMNKEMLLEEQITSLDNEVKLLRNLLNSKAEVEASRDLYKEKLLQWTSIGQNMNSEFSCPQKFKTFISQTQNDLFEMKLDNTTLKCKVDIMSRDLEKLQSEITVTTNQEKTKTEENEKLSTDLKQLSRRFMLLTKDRDGLKSLKESYEQELEGIISVALRERVNQLEALVGDYEKLISEDPTLKKSCHECDKRIKLISELRSELDRARNYPNASTMGDVTMSDGNTTGVQIVSFGLNPSTLSIEARIKELSAENESLKEKIKQLEENSLMGPSDVMITEDRKLLEEQLRTLERKHQILTEAYDYETQQLQTALSKLFGYHVILVREPQSQFRLQSVYGSGPADELIFQEAENSDMMLLETPILDHFRDDIERFLLREGSIPAFLSTVTISFSQGHIQPSVDPSQLPSSQQSSQNSGETVTINPSGRKMVQVEVEGQSDVESEEGSEIGEEVEPEEDEEAMEEEEHEEPYSDEEEDDSEEEEGRRDVEFQDQGSDNDIVCIDSD